MKKRLWDTDSGEVVCRIKHDGQQWNPSGLREGQLNMFGFSMMPSAHYEFAALSAAIFANQQDKFARMTEVVACE